jgi:hypothetical protein
MPVIWTVTVGVCEKECVVPAASKASSLAQSQGSSMEVGTSIEDHLCGANFDDTHTLPFEEMAGLITQPAACSLQAWPRSGRTHLYY